MKCSTCRESGLIVVETRNDSVTAEDALWCPYCGTYIESNGKAHTPTRSPYAQSLGGIKEMATHFASGIHQGLLIVAAEAVERANKLISTKSALPLAAEALSEAIAAVVHELDAQGEDIAEIVAVIGDQHPEADPDRIRDLLRRTLRRRRAKQ